VDSQGQSEVAVACCYLLGFELLPRLKPIHAQKLYRPTSAATSGKPEDYANLQPVLTRAIHWDLIVRQYDQLIKYATALRLGTADAETILRHFTKSNLQHPTYQALAELGKVVKTMFLCAYLRSEALRQEIQEGLNVLESWNSANAFIFYGKSGEIATNRLEEQEVSILALPHLQIALVFLTLPKRGCSGYACGAPLRWRLRGLPGPTARFLVRRAGASSRRTESFFSHTGEQLERRDRALPLP
jgi:TnpA family transposase